MPDKDLAIQQAIESVIGKSRKGRSKIIHLVQKNDPTLGVDIPEHIDPLLGV